MVLVLLYLCIQRRGATKGHVFLQLALEMTNIVVLIFAIFMQDFEDPSDTLKAFLFNVCTICYMLGHWVFVSQYYKVSQLMPYVLEGLQVDLRQSNYSSFSGRELKRKVLLVNILVVILLLTVVVI